MKAGRELDALVAEKVLDWELRRESWYDEEGVEATVLYDDKGDKLGDSLGWDWPDDFPEELPPFSTDIAAAWKVVEAMQKRTKPGDVKLRQEWYAFIEAVQPQRFPLVCDVAATAAERICLAALEALGVTE